MPGFWQYSPARDTFWLDRDSLALVGCANAASRSMPRGELRELLCIDPEEEILFQQVVESPSEGDVLLCSITLYAGPYSGRQCAVRASVMGRDAAGRALSLVGNIRLLSDTGVDDPGVNPDMALLTLDISGDGMWDWFPKTGRVEYSPRFRAMLGYSPLQFPNSMEAWEGIIHPDDRVRANRALYNIVEPHGATVPGSRNQPHAVPAHRHISGTELSVRETDHETAVRGLQGPVYDKHVPVMQPCIGKGIPRYPAVERGLGMTHEFGVEVDHGTELFQIIDISHSLIRVMRLESRSRSSVSTVSPTLFVWSVMPEVNISEGTPASRNQLWSPILL